MTDDPYPDFVTDAEFEALADWGDLAQRMSGCPVGIARDEYFAEDEIAPPKFDVIVRRVK